MKMIFQLALVTLILSSCTRKSEKETSKTFLSSNKTENPEDSTSHQLIDSTPVYYLMDTIESENQIITHSPIGELVNDFSEIKYLNQDLEILKIEWRVETSVTVTGEGPHCDLIYWKHAYTPWKTVIEDSIPEHEVRIYDQFKESWGLFPKVTMDELKKYVRGYCKEGWYQYIKNAQTIEDRTLSIGISKLIFRVNFKSKDGKKYFSKIFHQELAMGC